MEWKVSVTNLDLFIDRKVVVLNENEEVLTAAKAMCAAQVGCVVLMNNEGRLSGVVTDRDITCNLISLDLDAHARIHEIMEGDVVYLSSSGTVEEAVDKMKEYGIRRLPIIEKQGKKDRCIGVVTLDDLLAGQHIGSSDISQIVRAQIMRKKRIRKMSVVLSQKENGKYNLFIARLAKRLNLSNVKTRDLTFFILSSIVKRLHYTGGAHLISQLPKKLQIELLDLPAGPDRRIGERTIVQGTSIRTETSLKEARRLVAAFWSELCVLIGEGETNHVIRQLPQQMRALLVQPHLIVPLKFQGDLHPIEGGV